VIRTRLFDPDDPAATLANLVEHESLARLGIAVDLGIVITQALVAVWFYRLFRSVDHGSATTSGVAFRCRDSSIGARCSCSRRPIRRCGCLPHRVLGLIHVH
jgi:hypothetical protein